MFARRLGSTACSAFTLTCVAFVATACDPDGLRPPPKNNGADGSGGSVASSAGGAAAGTPVGVGGSAGAPPAEGATAALIPARIRRLSNAEYNASASALLGTPVDPANSFAPDARQDGFTVNDSQRVDPVLAKQLFAAAEELAASVRPSLGELAPCDAAGDREVCAASFIDAFGKRAYRRPLVSEEADGLLEVYRVGSETGRYEDGIELVIRAVLQSAGFLYLTELGDGMPDASGVVQLTADELASSLSYLITAGPPDDALRAAAESGKLSDPDGRAEELLRLRQTESADDRLVRAIREWLELDLIETTAKDSTVYGQYDGLKDSIVAESHEFVRTVLGTSNPDGDVAQLLGADWTVAEPGLAGLYGGAEMGGGLLELPERRGMLNQAAFLSVQAHAHESSPVLRGVLIARRLACLDIPSPSTLNIDVVPPVPDPTQTTRERFEVHTSDPGCATCHKSIDGFGNAFEQFDGMGSFRNTENGKPVIATTTVSVEADFDGDYANSNELAEALARSPLVRDCFARHLFRAVAGRSNASVYETEQAFIAEWARLPEAQQGNVMDTLVAFVKSPIFSQRRVQ